MVLNCILKACLKGTLKVGLKAVLKVALKGCLKVSLKGILKAFLKDSLKILLRSLPYGVNRDNFDGKIHPIWERFLGLTGGIH